MRRRRCLALPSGIGFGSLAAIAVLVLAGSVARAQDPQRRTAPFDKPGATVESEANPQPAPDERAPAAGLTHEVKQKANDPYISRIRPTRQVTTPGAPVQLTVEGLGQCVVCVDRGDGTPEQCSSPRGAQPLPHTYRPSYARGGQYEFKASGGGRPDGCRGEASATIVVNPLRETGVAPGKQGIAQGAISRVRVRSKRPTQGEITDFRVEGMGTCSVCFDAGDGSEERCSNPGALPIDFGYDYQTPGTFTVTATGSEGEHDCGSARTMVRVFPMESPEALTKAVNGKVTDPHISRIVPPHEVVKPGDHVELEILGFGKCVVCLDRGDGAPPFCSSWRGAKPLPLTLGAAYAKPGTYQLTASGGGQSHGCKGEAHATIEVTDENRILGIAPVPRPVGELSDAWVLGVGECVICVDMDTSDEKSGPCTKGPAPFPQSFGTRYEKSGTYTVSAVGGKGPDGCLGSATATLQVP